MMRKKTHMLVALMLTMVMALTGCGDSKNPSDTETNKDSQEVANNTESDNTESDNTESDYPEYLNMDYAYPVVKDEYKDDIVLKVAVAFFDNAASEWDDLWISRYLTDKYNLNFDVEILTFDMVQERKSIMLSSGELPDLMLSMGFQPMNC